MQVQFIVFFFFFFSDQTKGRQKGMGKKDMGVQDFMGYKLLKN
jgi:hypothetical protein